MDDILGIIGRIGEKETSLLSAEFISPVYGNRLVATSVEGMVYKFQIPKTAPGWYKIRPKDQKSAQIIGPAELIDIENYLKRLYKIRVTLIMKRKGIYMGIADKTNPYGFSYEELVPVFLCDDTANAFDRVLARYDGGSIWFERVDSSNDPAKAEYLRDCALKLTDPAKIKYTGLLFEERQAYAVRLGFDKKFAEEKKKTDIQRDVEFAGGTFVESVERNDFYSVTYKVDGQTFTSHISKDPRRMVISAGLCLNGNDRHFDLKSLVTVIREGQDRKIIYKYNLDNRSDTVEDYHDEDEDW